MQNPTARYSIAQRPVALAAFAGTLLPSVLFAQEAGPAEAQRSVTPVTAVDPSSTPSRQVNDTLSFPIEIADEGVVVRAAEVSDDIPLPNPAVYEATDAGDVLVSEASGDPFFLGFARSSHYPPQDEILDPALVTAASLQVPDARPEAVTYGFVMFSKRITDERVAQLEELGVRVLGFHPHYALRVALPVGDIGAVSTLDFVRWVGTARVEQKFHPAMEAELAQVLPGQLAEVHVSVFEADTTDAMTFKEIGRSDLVSPDGTTRSVNTQLTRVYQSNGWMQAVLEEAGAEIVAYSPRLNAFQVKIDPSQLEAIAQADFVQFIEPVAEPELNAAALPHDESRALVASDRVTGAFNGGTNEAAIVGMVDSGLELDHQDLNIWGVGWNCTTEASTWDDTANGGNGHGTHVAG
ncbi:MAG: hypothetical protein AAGG01_17620, partial [Planctomycetota bacterium]